MKLTRLTVSAILALALLAAPLAAEAQPARRPIGSGFWQICRLRPLQSR